MTLSSTLINFLSPQPRHPALGEVRQGVRHRKNPKLKTWGFSLSVSD
jgi:hypothetical protein